jgi:hypothetical protein
MFLVDCFVRFYRLMEILYSILLAAWQRLAWKIGGPEPQYGAHQTKPGANPCHFLPSKI